MKKIKKVFCFLLIIFLFYLIENTLLSNNSILNYLIYGKHEQINILRNNNLLSKISNSVTNFDSKDVASFLNYDGNKYLNKTNPNITNVITIKDPIIYIYNTHDTEEYSNKGFEGYNANITVKLASYMLQDELLKYNIPSIVEEKGVISELKKENLEYKYSYSISNRYALEQKEKHPSLIYFIDIHRDGISKDLSTIKINDLDYAKIMFFIGKNHENSNKNLATVKDLEDYLKSKYSNFVRDTYIKNDYSYFQDISPKAFLVEVGGQDNTFYEVYNSISLLAEALAHQIGVIND